MTRKKQRPAMIDERSPLLSNDAYPTVPPPPYSEVQSELNEIDDEDLVRCEVCSLGIRKDLKKNEKLVACPRCQEYTPLVPPEKGKIFIRCPDCNCLSVIQQSTKTCICPRDHCKKKMSIKGGKVSSSESSESNRVAPQPPQYRIVCGYCHGTFVQDTAPANNKIKCPLCRKSSRIGEGANRVQAICYISFGLALIIICFFLMITTLNTRRSSYWYIYIMLIAAIYFILRGIWSLCLKHSTLEITPSGSPSNV